MVEKNILGVGDYLVIAASLLVTAGIVIWVRFTTQKTTQDYMLAGRDMSKLPVILSISVTYMSATSMIGMPAEVYRFGTTLYVMVFASKVGMVIAAFVFIPVYFRCGVSTAYEYLEMRYGKTIKNAVSALFLLQMVLYMAVTLYGPALALSAVTNLSTETSVLVFGLVCTFYCMMGGLKAVLWTDSLQAVLMAIFIILLFSQGVYEAGGLGEIIRISEEGKRFNLLNFSPDMTIRYTFWGCLVRGIVTGAAIYGTTQNEVQRMLSVRNTSRAKSSLLWTTVPLTFLHVSCLFTGLVMYANFYDCDPVKNKAHTGVMKHDQVIPYYIVTRFSVYPGLTGLCIAGIFSGSLSTVSSALNSVSTVTVLDILTPITSLRFTEKRAVYVAKFLSGVYGIITIALTFALSKVDSIFYIVTMFMGLAEGPVFGIFLIGVLTRKGSEKCALFGFIIGVAFTFWLGFGILFSGFRTPSLPLSTSGCSSEISSLLTNSTFSCPLNTTCELSMTSKVVTPSEPFFLHKVSFTWLSPLGCLVTVCSTLLAVLLTGRQNFIEENSRCLSPVVRVWTKQKRIKRNAPIEGITKGKLSSEEGHEVRQELMTSSI